MADPAWPCSSPETNYLRLVGPGSAGTATTLVSGSAWEALLGSNELAFSMSTMNTVMTSADFQGIGGASSSSTVGVLNAALQLLSSWAQEKPPIAATAVAAYEAAVASMIPAEVSIANRTEQAADVAANPAVFGALTPAIVGLDSEYFGEHWPHNAAAGAAYGAVLAGLVAALAIPPPLAPPGASPVGPATAAASVAQAAGTSAMNSAMEAARELNPAATVPAQGAMQAGQLGSNMMQPLQAAVGAMQPLIGMFSAPAQAVQGLSGVPQSMLGSLGGLFPGMAATDATVPGQEVVRAAGVANNGTSVGGGCGGYPGAGLTSYTRPTGSFSPAVGGRPLGLRVGLLSAELRGPTTVSGISGVPPMAPGTVGSGMLGAGRPPSREDARSEPASARIAIPEQPLNRLSANDSRNTDD